MNKITAVVFDIGGVLIESLGSSQMLEWLSNGMTEEEFKKAWSASPSVRSFETGRINEAQFSEAIIKELSLNVGVDEFKQFFSSSSKKFFSGVNEFLEKLSKSYTIACLSNTNPEHWSEIDQNDGMNLFNKKFLSYKTGFMKPDKEAFMNVATELGCEPQNILFFDDTLVNIESAKKCGFNAVRVNGFDDVKEKIKAFNLNM